MVVLVVFLVVLLAGIAGTALLVGVLIRRAGADQQARVDAEVKAFIDDMHTLPPEVAAKQAQVEKDLAAGDALMEQVQAQDAPATPTAQPTEPPLDPSI